MCVYIRICFLVKLCNVANHELDDTLHTLCVSIKKVLARCHACWRQCNNVSYMAVCQNLVPLVNIKIAGKWMFIPLKMVIGIDPYPYNCYDLWFEPPCPSSLIWLQTTEQMNVKTKLQQVSHSKNLQSLAMSYHVVSFWVHQSLHHA